MKQRTFFLTIIAAMSVFTSVASQEKTGGGIDVYVLGTKEAEKSDLEWIDMVERKCNAALASMQQSRDAIGELKQTNKGDASVMFITAASAAMANFANQYYESMGMFIASYRAGEVSGARERFTEYNSWIASGLKGVSNGYKDAQSNMAAAGIPKSLVDTIAKAFSVAAKEIEDEVLPAIQSGR